MYDILGGMLEQQQKKENKGGKKGNLNKRWTLVNNNVFILAYELWQIYHDNVRC